MVMHSRILAWRTPWTEEPDGLQSMASQKSSTWLSDWHCLFILTGHTWLSLTISPAGKWAIAEAALLPTSKDLCCHIKLAFPHWLSFQL